MKNHIHPPFPVVYQIQHSLCVLVVLYRKHYDSADMWYIIHCIIDLWKETRYMINDKYVVSWCFNDYIDNLF